MKKVYNNRFAIYIIILLIIGLFLHYEMGFRLNSFKEYFRNHGNHHNHYHDNDDRHHNYYRHHNYDPYRYQGYQEDYEYYD